MTNIREKALLLRVDLKAWSGTKADKEVTKDITTQKKAAKDSGRFNKKLLNGSLAEVKAVQTEVRKFIAENTLFWDEYYRLVPVEKFEAINNYLAAKQLEHTKKVKMMLEKYTQNVEKDKKKLGEMFKAKDYPSKEKMAAKFSIGFKFKELPRDDFRVQLTESDIEDIRQQQEQMIHENLAVGQRVLWFRLKEHVTQLMKILRESKTIHAAPFERTLELVKSLRELNIMGDQELNKMADDVELILGNIDVEEIRKDKVVREDSLKAAKGIMEKLGQFASCAA